MGGRSTPSRAASAHGRPLTLTSEHYSLEAPGNNRSVMPFDVSGDTRATLMQAESVGGAPWHSSRGAGEPPSLAERPGQSAQTAS